MFLKEKKIIFPKDLIIPKEKKAKVASWSNLSSFSPEKWLFPGEKEV